MDLTKILAQVRNGIELGQNIAGPLATFGIPGAGLAKALLEIAENIEQRISDGVIVVTSEDRAAVKQMIEELQAENDRLAAEIEQS